MPFDVQAQGSAPWPSALLVALDPAVGSSQAKHFSQWQQRQHACSATVSTLVTPKQAGSGLAGNSASATHARRQHACDCQWQLAQWVREQRLLTGHCCSSSGGQRAHLERGWAGWADLRPVLQAAAAGALQLPATSAGLHEGAACAGMDLPRLEWGGKEGGRREGTSTEEFLGGLARVTSVLPYSLATGSSQVELRPRPPPTHTFLCLLSSPGESPPKGVAPIACGPVGPLCSLTARQYSATSAPRQLASTVQPLLPRHFSPHPPLPLSSVDLQRCASLAQPSGQWWPCLHFNAGQQH